MSRILRPFHGLEGRAETTPEFVLYRDLLGRSVRSLILYVWGLGMPRPIVWQAFAIDTDAPAQDRGVVALDDARQFLAALRPRSAALEGVRAFQIVVGERSASARINHEVQGRLTMRMTPDPAPPHRPIIQLQFDPSPDQPNPASSFLVLHWNKEGRSSFIVLWDIVPMVVGRLSADQVAAKVRESLPPGGARQRWAGLLKIVQPDEVVSAYYIEGIARPDAEDLAFRVLDHLERSARAGQPSRKTHGILLPLHDPDSPPGGQGQSEGERFGLTAPEDVIGEDVRIDLDRAVSRLDQRSQEIFRLYYEGLTDAEIALEFGVSQQAVNKTRLRTVAMLRNILGG